MKIIKTLDYKKMAKIFSNNGNSTKIKNHKFGSKNFGSN